MRPIVVMNLVFGIANTILFHVTGMWIHAAVAAINFIAVMVSADPEESDE